MVFHTVKKKSVFGKGFFFRLQYVDLCKRFINRHKQSLE